MILSYDDLVCIVERAGTLHERLSDRFVSDGVFQRRDDLVRSRLERWCDTAAGGDRERFWVRLDSEGLDMDAVRKGLGAVRLKQVEPLAPWANTLDGIVRLMEERAQDFHMNNHFSPPANAADPRVCGATFPASLPRIGKLERLPHAAILEPFVRFARRQLRDRCSTQWPALSEDAWGGLERHLLQRLSSTAQATLDLKFDAYLSLRRPPFFGQESKASTDDPLYVEFSKRMLSGGWPGTLREFPVLARLLATLVDFWIHSTSLFLDHLEKDRHLIEDLFFSGERMGSVAAIGAGLSDPHLCGRTVMEVTFDSGLRLLYKPKDLEMDAAWFKLLEWLNGLGISHPFRILKVVPRSGYGWMEYVKGMECRDRNDAEEYYYQAGRLLCLVYVLEGTDFQHENMVAGGSQPVLIDLETLMQPHSRILSSSLSPRRFPETVLRTHFLPYWSIGLEGRPAWLGGIDRAQALNGAGLALADYADEVCDGFRNMYFLLLRHRDRIAAPNGPLHDFAGCKTRPVFNDTSVYESICRKSLEPKALRDGAERSIVIERLYRLPVTGEALRELSPRCREEVKAIERLDVPRFESRTDNSALYTESSQPIGDLFLEAPLESVHRNILHLNIHDLERQVELIRAAIGFKEAAGEGRACPDGIMRVSLEEIGDDHEALCTSGGFLDAAGEIAERICRSAVRTRSGAAAWMVPTGRPADGKILYSFSHSDSFLYNGATGIALFLASMESVQKGSGYGELARDALKPILAFVAKPYLHGRVGIGGAEGLGAIIYGLVKIASFLDDPSLVEAAEKVASLITAEKIAADTRYDLLAGSAGALLGLLSLHKITGNPKALSLAVKCGEHLLSSRVVGQAFQPAPHKVWKTIQDKPVTGLAHGMAGIACALARLFSVTGEESFLEAASEAVVFERAQFSPAHGNWLAFGSTSEKPIIWNAFCHGAAGIGLARIAGLPWMDTPEVRHDIDVAIEAAISHPANGIDFLCCGSFGRIELATTAAERLKRPDLLEASRLKAGKLLRKKKERGYFGLFSDLPPSIDNPSFFRGTAGIGYALLRLAFPERLPCILIWE